jgi:hypothetical protein
MSENARIRALLDAIPAGWDLRPITLVQEIRTLIKPLTDEGSSMDTGTANGEADMWFTVGGAEFLMTIKSPKAPDHE